MVWVKKQVSPHLLKYEVKIDREEFFMVIDYKECLIRFQHYSFKKYCLAEKLFKYSETLVPETSVQTFLLNLMGRNLDNYRHIENTSKGLDPPMNMPINSTVRNTMGNSKVFTDRDALDELYKVNSMVAS